MRAVLLVVLVSACRSAPQPRGDVCIVTAQQASDIERSSDGARYFTPSRADIDALQATLGDFLSTQRGAAHIVDTLSRYRGVFVGATVDGHRIVRASYSCNQYETCAERAGSIVFDGGDCYFEVDFDLESRTYKNLYIHGVA